MIPYSQANRLMRITTPLGPDVVLIDGLRGREAISELYRFELDLLVKRPLSIPFEKLLDQPVGVHVALSNQVDRLFHGIVSRLVQQARDDTFTHYRADLVPKPWLLTRRFRSRIFQQKSVPEILQNVLGGFDYSLELSEEYPSRDFTVQWAETDLAFVSRLLAEEGIGYFFRHEQDRHEMVFFDNSLQLADLPGHSTVLFDETTDGVRDDVRINRWSKSQTICHSRVTLWDHSFELPGQTLEASRRIDSDAKCGEVEHLLPGTDEPLEAYLYPGGYARWFDGVDPGGALRPDDPANTFEQNERIAKVRSQEFTANAFEISGSGNCLPFRPGSTFSLLRHFNGDGKYLLLSVAHDARLSAGFRSGDGEPTLDYTNYFKCLPDSTPFRPRRRVPRPIIHGVQTATVVGPKDSELFVDKYGRVKVQFHWDREGGHDAGSSCWIRVGQIWAGATWGACFWLRVGHEVIVAFVDGDPDQPVIVGSVYNAKNMPPVDLPEGNTIAGIKSKIFGGDPATNFNALLFHDAAGEEFLHLHSETHEMTNSETNKYHYVPQSQFEFHGSF